MAVTIPTPFVVRDMARALNTDMTAFNAFLLGKSQDIANDPGLFPINAWSGFFGRWVAWFALHDSPPAATGYMDPGAVTTILSLTYVNAQRARLESYQETAAKAWEDTPAVGPWPDTGIPDINEVKKEISGTVKLVVVVGILYALHEFFKKKSG